jgi:[ribosomal protein S18]-alanine N-acetyltransferase
MNNFKIYNSENKPNNLEKKELIDFLYEHLEQFGDTKIAIEKAIDFAIIEYISFGGFVLVSYTENIISGVVVVNQTGMKDYIPENILVYIATHKDFRGQGIGKSLMKKTVELAKGNIALHVEPENPARFLYEKIGFTSKYIEMRLIKK